MPYLLDTSVLVDHLRGSKTIPNDIRKQGPYVSIISVGELLCGANKSTAPKKQTDKIEELLSEVLILPVTLDIIKVYAQERVLLEKLGLRLDNFDLLIAATAINGELSLITSNRKHFERIKKLKLLR